jgi:hypothetical protein
MSKQTLEARIAGALGNGNQGSEDLFELIADVEAAAVDAAATAEREKARALDITAAPDASKAHERVATAVLIRDRLNAVLPRLRARLAAATATERRERYRADYKRIKEQRDAAAKQLEHACALAEQIAAACREAERVDQEISRLHGSAPNDAMERLASVELYARNLEAFTTNTPSLLENTRLFDWETGKSIWPPPAPSLAAGYAATMSFGHDPRYSGDWWRVQQQDQERQAANAARWNEAEAKREVEAKRKFEESFRGKQP